MSHPRPHDMERSIDDAVALLTAAAEADAQLASQLMFDLLEEMYQGPEPRRRLADALATMSVVAVGIIDLYSSMMGESSTEVLRRVAIKHKEKMSR